jgi:hypothetical protein
LFQFNNMLSHKKVYQYTNTVLKNYAANTEVVLQIRTVC